MGLAVIFALLTQYHACIGGMNLVDLFSCLDDVIKWKHFPRYWPFVWGIHRSPVNSPHKGQWCGALMFSLICTWINSWVNNGEAGDLRHHHTHYDVTVMWSCDRLLIYSISHRICTQFVVLCFKAETKWPPFSRLHFQMHFLEWKCMNIDSNFTEVCS